MTIEQADDHAPSETDSDDADEDSTVGVTGLEQLLRVEITHVPSGASKVLNLQADALEPGRYTSERIVPTVPGAYEFRVFGVVDGTAVNEVFPSRGAGGGFDDVSSATPLQFPESVPSQRELESAVRGAVTTADKALEAASSAQATAEAVAAADDGGSSAETLAIVAVILGVIAIVISSGSMILSRARR